MKIISHRGNIRGRVPERENAPSYIDCALGNGYDVEIDVRVHDGDFWLGHDEAQYRVTWNWLALRQNNLWIHCKNAEAAKQCYEFQSFCHNSDPFTYTSKGQIWVHDFRNTIDEKTIIPLLAKGDVEQFHHLYQNAYGICTDYPIDL